MPDTILSRTYVKDAAGKITFDTAPKAGDTVVAFKESPAKVDTRLVHDGTKVIALFDSNGFTWTKNVLFCGTSKECDDEITLLALKPLPVDAGSDPGTIKVGKLP